MKDMMKEMDLHLHTYYSDGSMSPEDVIKYVASQGKTLVAITDHDGTDGVKEAVEAGKKLEIEVIPGIEFSTVTDKGIRIHMLGYAIDIENPDLKEALAHIRSKRHKRNERLLQALNDLGFALTEKDLVLRENQDFIGKPIFARALANRGYLKDPREAFGPKGIFNLPEIRAIKKQTISTEKAINLIHTAGGKAVLAHPGKIIGLKCMKDPEVVVSKGSQEFYQAIEDLICQLVAEGLDGMECFHTDHSQRDTQEFLAMAEKYRLWITKGSDYHGPEFA